MDVALQRAHKMHRRPLGSKDMAEHRAVSLHLPEQPLGVHDRTTATVSVPEKPQQVAPRQGILRCQQAGGQTRQDSYGLSELREVRR